MNRKSACFSLGRLRLERGFMLVMTLLFLLLVLLVAVALLATTTNAASSSFQVQTKDQAFNAAETGLNAAIYQLQNNRSLASGTTGSGSVKGYAYNWEVVQNSLSSASATTDTDIDPVYSGSVPVGAHQAYVAGWASSIAGGRTVYVEGVVVTSPPLNLTQGAIVAGGNAQISHEQITDISGNHAADIHGQHITSSGGGQIPDGNSYAACMTAGCNAITGYDGEAHISAAPPSFLTAS